MAAVPVSLTDKASRPAVKRLSYPSVILLTGLHVGALVAVWYVIVHGVTARHWVSFAALAIGTVACVTIGYHRLETHGGFKAPSWVRAVLLFGGGMSLQGTAKEWVANHRVHHAFNDRIGLDPHSPLEYPGLKGLLWAHVGWLLVRYERPARYRRFDDLERDGLINWQRRWYLLAVAASFLVPLLFLGLSGLLVAGVLRVVVVLNVTWSINSICHAWGQRATDSAGRPSLRGASRNNVLIAILSFGEGYHANHHVRPTWAYHGWKWHDVDPSKWLIAALERCGLAWDIKKPDATVVFARVPDRRS